jgi:hypothetical protein
MDVSSTPEGSGGRTWDGYAGTPLVKLLDPVLTGQVNVHRQELERWRIGALMHFLGLLTWTTDVKKKGVNHQTCCQNTIRSRNLRQPLMFGLLSLAAISACNNCPTDSATFLLQTMYEDIPQHLPCIKELVCAISWPLF